MFRRATCFSLIFFLLTSTLSFSEETSQKPSVAQEKLVKKAPKKPSGFRTKEWQNWALAGLATAAAIVTLILVAHNHHHHHHHHHHDQ